MKKSDKNVVIGYINVGGMFGFKEDNIIEINKELWQFIESDSVEVKYLQYVLFGKLEDDLNIDYSSTIPNAQVSMVVDGVEFCVIRLPKYTKIDNDGKKTFVKEQLSYKYGEKVISSISNDKFELFVKDLLQITK